MWFWWRKRNVYEDWHEINESRRTLGPDKFQWNSISFICCHVNEYRIANESIMLSLLENKNGTKLVALLSICTNQCEFDTLLYYSMVNLRELILHEIFWASISFNFAEASHNINYQSSAIVFITNDVNSPRSLFSSHGRWVHFFPHSRSLVCRLIAPSRLVC